MRQDPILIDASRLIWRHWTRRLPTGIDRVCLAYLEHFAPRARAVVQFRRLRWILDKDSSARLFDLLLDGNSNFRSRLTRLLVGIGMRKEAASARQIYLNVGHTGLNSPFLGTWLARHSLRPVFLIHDLIPITHPQYCREGEDARHEQRIENALRAAKGLIVNSAATQHDLVQFADKRHLPVPPSLVAWLGVDEPLTATASTKFNQRRRPYFVLVGTIEARKNHLTMLQVWADLVARLGNEAPELIIIGQRGWEAEAVTAILDDPGPLKEHILEMPACDDQAMGQLVAGAQALLMPSFIEGFGLPLIEALQLGTPVIASDLPVFREIAADVPTYLNPLDRQAWVASILDYTQNGAERRRQQNAMVGFRAPSWRAHFDQVEQFLDRL